MKKVVYDSENDKIFIDGIESFEDNKKVTGLTEVLFEKIFTFPFGLLIINIILFYFMNSSLFLETFYKEYIVYDSHLNTWGTIKQGLHFSIASAATYWIVQ
jgi:hypothetical protein